MRHSHLRRSSFDLDPTLCDRLFELLELPFPGVTRGRRQGEAFGVAWEHCSTPFVVREGDAVVAHVGLLELPLCVLGRSVTVGGVHGVATHPDRRGQGLFRSIMDELLHDASDRFETLILTTLHPEYFRAFGFRVVPEYVHRAVIAPASVPDARPLDLANPTDKSLLHRLIESRTPVSHYLGVGVEKGCFGFTEFASTIRYSQALDTAVVADPTADGLRLYDVVAPRLPTMPQVLGIGNAGGRDLTCFFAPDRFAGHFAAEPHDLTGGANALEPGTPDWVLMVRGPFPCAGQPIMLPRPARC